MHDIRHLFASTMLTGGAELAAVSMLLGHSTIQMTERYSHLTPEHKRDAIERLSAYYSGEGATNLLQKGKGSQGESP